MNQELRMSAAEISAKTRAVRNIANELRNSRKNINTTTASLVSRWKGAASKQYVVEASAYAQNLEQWANNIDRFADQIDQYASRQFAKDAERKAALTGMNQR